MTRVLVAAPRPDVRAALRLLLVDMNMEVAGEAADWPAALALVPDTLADMLLVDWDLLNSGTGHTLNQLRAACPSGVVIVLLSQLDARQQAALSAGADAFISKGEMPDRVAQQLRQAASRVRWA